jgi:hypothetical protein
MIRELGTRGRVVGGLGGAMLALLAMSSPATAAPKRISGKVNESGYEVMALAASGEGSSTLADRNFSLRPPAKRVSLHLRAADGTYAGPVVLGKERKRGKRTIVGVRAGAKLGEVVVKPAKGYAKLAEAPPDGSLDRDQVARARNGAPIGAGNFGRVRSRHTDGAAADLDLDGLPDPLDVDDDGDLVLDNLDPSGARHEALRTPTDPCGPERIYCQVISSRLGLFFAQSVNANAGSSNDQINDALEASGELRIAIGAFAGPLQGPGDSAELDCGDPDTGLAYCRQNDSTGRNAVGGGPGPPFPACCHADVDGFGTLGPCCGGGPNDFFLAHGAQARETGLDPSIPQIGTGDPIHQWVTTGGDPSKCPPISDSCALYPALVQYVIASVPTLVAYDDGAGHSATPSYVPQPAGDAPGTVNNGFPVADSADDPDTDIEVTLTFWRPQRKPIPEEKCPEPDGPECDPKEWIDIGGLTYGADSGPSPAGGSCPQTNFTGFDPEQLSPPTIPPTINWLGGLTDNAPDRPADPGNTITYTLNLTQCLAAHGISFSAGDPERPIRFLATRGTNGAEQTVVFKPE